VCEGRSGHFLGSIATPIVGPRADSHSSLCSDGVSFRLRATLVQATLDLSSPVPSRLLRPPIGSPLERAKRCQSVLCSTCCDVSEISGGGPARACSRYGHTVAACLRWNLTYPQAANLRIVQSGETHHWIDLDCQGTQAGSGRWWSSLSFGLLHSLRAPQWIRPLSSRLPSLLFALACLWRACPSPSTLSHAPALATIAER